MRSSEPDRERKMAEHARTSLRAIAYLCRQLPGWEDRPVDDQLQLLQSMGFDERQSSAVIRALRRRDDDFPDPDLPGDGGGGGGGEEPEEPSNCELDWHPSVLAPVFYGARDLEKSPVIGEEGPILNRPATGVGIIAPWDGPPGRLRIFFPSLDGAVWSAPFLPDCGRYPVAVMVHGQCLEANHYQRWYRLPAQLARSGYVVVVPDLPYTRTGSAPWTNDAEVGLIEDILDWLRNEWEHREYLLPPPATVIIGHSYGALLGGRVAVRNEVAAYVSLSGVWTSWPESQAGPALLKQLSVPSLFTWGTGPWDGEVYAQLSDALWDQVPNPKHKLVSEDSLHWDYLPPGQPSCATDRGPCVPAGAVATDIVTLFASKYAPPERWPNLKTAIGNNLLRPSYSLSIEQQFYAGGHLMGLEMLDPGEPGCEITQSWETASGATGSVTLVEPKVVVEGGTGWDWWPF